MIKYRTETDIRTLNMVCIECGEKDTVVGWILDEYGMIPEMLVERHPWTCFRCSKPIKPKKKVSTKGKKRGRKTKTTKDNRN